MHKREQLLLLMAPKNVMNVINSFLSQSVPLLLLLRLLLVNLLLALVITTT